MAGDKLYVARKVQSRLGLERTLGGKRDSHKGRLGIFRKRQRIGWALEDDCAELATKRFVNLFENLLRAGEIGREGLAHPYGLAALPRNTKRSP